jgi:antitoxin MazE
VSLPAGVLEKVKLAAGSEVEVSVDEDHGRILIEPVRPSENEYPPGVDPEFVAQVNEFIEQGSIGVRLPS